MRLNGGFGAWERPFDGEYDVLEKELCYPSPFWTLVYSLIFVRIDFTSKLTDCPMRTFGAPSY